MLHHEVVLDADRPSGETIIRFTVPSVGMSHVLGAPVLLRSEKFWTLTSLEVTQADKYESGQLVVLRSVYQVLIVPVQELMTGHNLHPETPWPTRIPCPVRQHLCFEVHQPKSAELVLRVGWAHERESEVNDNYMAQHFRSKR